MPFVGGIDAQATQHREYDVHVHHHRVLGPFRFGTRIREQQQWEQQQQQQWQQFPSFAHSLRQKINFGPPCIGQWSTGTPTIFFASDQSTSWAQRTHVVGLPIGARIESSMGDELVGGHGPRNESGRRERHVFVVRATMQRH